MKIVSPPPFVHLTFERASVSARPLMCQVDAGGGAA